MAEVNPPSFVDVSSAFSGHDFGLPNRDLVAEGVVQAGALAASQRAAGANLSVDVAAGACWVTGDTNVDRQPTYRCINDAVVNKGITPDPSNPRRVLVVAQIVDETYAGTGRLWRIDANHGTPAASPALPATPASALPLADITVAAAATSITNANIVDLRQAAGVPGQLRAKGCRVFNSAAIALATSTPTSLTFDSDRWDSDNMHDTTGAFTSRLVCKTAGKYHIFGHVEFAASAAGTYRQLAIFLNTTTNVAMDMRSPIGGGAQPTRCSVSTGYDLAVGDFVELRATQDSGGNLNVTVGANYSPEFGMYRVGA